MGNSDQSERFKAAARELETDDNAERFDAAIKKIAKAGKKAENDTKPDKGDD